MEYRVFYSWQADLPNSTNRGFIQKALENAARAIRRDETIRIEPVVDRDTQGVPGSPDIARTILEKIEQSQVFVCDVSIINHRSDFRKTPNPNVLVELGYALRAMGERLIIMVMNTPFGSPENLPFNLRQKRVVTYCVSVSDPEKAPARHKLESQLEAAFRAIFESAEMNVLPSAPSPSPELVLKLFKMDDRRREYQDDISFKQEGPSRQSFRFGVALLNTTDSATAERIVITLRLSNPFGLPLEKAPVLEAPKEYEGWTPKTSNLVSERPAIVTFAGAGLLARYNHPVEWDDFGVALPTKVQGQGPLKVGYTISYNDASTGKQYEDSGNLKIYLS